MLGSGALAWGQVRREFAAGKPQGFLPRCRRNGASTDSIASTLQRTSGSEEAALGFPSHGPGQHWSFEGSRLLPNILGLLRFQHIEGNRLIREQEITADFERPTKSDEAVTADFSDVDPSTPSWRVEFHQGIRLCPRATAGHGTCPAAESSNPACSDQAQHAYSLSSIPHGRAMTSGIPQVWNLSP